MPVDPPTAAMLAMLADMGAPPVYEGTPEAGRAGYLQMTVSTRAPEQVVPVASTEDRVVPGAEGDLRARVYRPEGTGPFPVIAFFHGGGWVIGDLETHDNMARNLCRGARAVVVSIDYRLAPEHPFPAAADDAVASARWIAGHLGELGGTDLDGTDLHGTDLSGTASTRLSVAGDSAGGNLAAVVSQQLTSEGTPLAGQLLIYPAVDAKGGYPSRAENAKGYLLEQESINWFLGHYAGSRPDIKDPRLSPLYGDLSGLPPAIIVTAEFDPLRDDGEAYGKALEAAGGRADVRCYPGMIHGFFDMGAFSPAAQTAIEETCARFGDLIRG
jgi:acetyl esterase